MITKRFTFSIILLLIYSTVFIICETEQFSITVPVLDEFNRFKYEETFQLTLSSKQLLQLRRYDVVDVEKVIGQFAGHKHIQRVSLMFNETVMYISPSVYSTIEQISLYVVVVLDVLINIIIPNGMIIYLFLSVLALIVWKYVLLALASVIVTLILNIILSIQYFVFIDRIQPPLINTTSSYISSTIYTQSAYFRFKDSLLEINPTVLLLSEDAPGNRELRLVLAEFAISLDNMLLLAYENFPYVLMIGDSFICTIFHFKECGAQFGLCELLFDEVDGFIMKPLITLNRYWEQLDAAFDVIPNIPDEFISGTFENICVQLFLSFKSENGCPCEACKFTGVTKESFERVSVFLGDLGFENAAPCDPFGQCCLIAAIDYQYYDSMCELQQGDWYTSIFYFIFPAQFLPGAGEFELITPPYCTEFYLSVFDLLGFTNFNSRILFIEQIDDFWELPYLPFVDNEYIPQIYWASTCVDYGFPFTNFYCWVDSTIQGLPFPYSIESVSLIHTTVGSTDNVGNWNYDIGCEGECTTLPNLCSEFNLVKQTDTSVEIHRDKVCFFLMLTLGFCFGESEIDLSENDLANVYQNSRLTCPAGLKFKYNIDEKLSSISIQRQYICDLHYQTKWGLDSHWKNFWLRGSINTRVKPYEIIVVEGFAEIDRTNSQYIIDFIMQESSNITLMCDIFFSGPSLTKTVASVQYTTYTACLRDFNILKDNGMDFGPADFYPPNRTNEWSWGFGNDIPTLVNGDLTKFIPGTSQHSVYKITLRDLNDMMDQYGNEKYSYKKLIENMTQLSEPFFNSTSEYETYKKAFFKIPPNEDSYKRTIDHYLNHVNYLSHLGQNYDCDNYDYKEEFALHFNLIRATQRNTYTVGHFIDNFFREYFGGWTNVYPISVLVDVYIITYNYIYDDDDETTELSPQFFEKHEERLKGYKLFKMFTKPGWSTAIERNDERQKAYDDVYRFASDYLDATYGYSPSQIHSFVDGLLLPIWDDLARIFSGTPGVWSTFDPGFQFIKNGTVRIADYVITRYLYPTVANPAINHVFYFWMLRYSTTQFCYGDNYILGVPPDPTTRISQWPVSLCSAYSIIGRDDIGTNPYVVGLPPWNFEGTRLFNYEYLKYLLEPDYNTCDVVKKFFQEVYPFGIGARVLSNMDNYYEIFDC